MKKRIIVGATGASGMPVLVKCLELIRAAEGFESWLIISGGARLTIRQELGDFDVWSKRPNLPAAGPEGPGMPDVRPGGPEDPVSRVEALADHVLSPEEIGAGPASGSFQTSGMLIVPCSMKTVAGICAGYAENLILRAADVTIKEQRPLVLAARETPLSPIHLRNLKELSMMPGVRIIPPMMTFYHRPETIDEMVYHVAAKLLEPFGIEAEEYRRWNGL